MKKSELKELMKKRLIFESDIDYVCEFVEAVLIARAEETKRDYPYAWKSIQKYEEAAYEVYELIDYINEILEGEDE